MISDEIGRQLHNRSTIGEQLTNLEKEQLDAWYAKLDAVESKLLGSDVTDSTINLANLQTQIESSLRRNPSTRTIPRFSSVANSIKRPINEFICRAASLIERRTRYITSFSSESTR